MNSNLLVAFEEYLSVTKALDTLTVSSYISDLKQLEALPRRPTLFHNVRK